jgi:phosphatidylserine decarboxylase
MSILKEGFPFISQSLAAALALFAVSWVVESPVSIVCTALGVVFVILAFFCVFFFRDPRIKITQGEGIILSPCNGTVMEVLEEGGEKIVRVFLSIFSVHLQRSPVSGTVTSVNHKDGKFFAAWKARAQSENEQNVITIQGSNGAYTVRQIAGFLARRCVSWVRADDVLKAGDKIGMIKFSSQVDTHLPVAAEIKVRPGDKIKAGITVIALNTV